MNVSGITKILRSISGTAGFTRPRVSIPVHMGSAARRVLYPIKLGINFKKNAILYPAFVRHPHATPPARVPRYTPAITLSTLDLPPSQVVDNLPRYG